MVTVRLPWSRKSSRAVTVTVWGTFQSEVEKLKLAGLTVAVAVSLEATATSTPADG